MTSSTAAKETTSSRAARGSTPSTGALATTSSSRTDGSNTGLEGPPVLRGPFQATREVDRASTGALRGRNAPTRRVAAVLRALAAERAVVIAIDDVVGDGYSTTPP